MSDAAKEIVLEYEEGALTEGGLFAPLTQLVPGTTLEEIVEVLPSESQTANLAWLTELYGPQADLSTHVRFNVEPDTEERVAEIRRWLATNHAPDRPPSIGCHELGPEREPSR